eukprot:1185305-Prorocentrum_minimum.AAC.1
MVLLFGMDRSRGGPVGASGGGRRREPGADEPGGGPVEAGADVSQALRSQVAVQRARDIKGTIDDHTNYKLAFFGAAHDSGVEGARDNNKDGASVHNRVLQYPSEAQLVTACAKAVGSAAHLLLLQ